MRKLVLFYIITGFVGNIDMTFSGNINSINQMFKMKNKYIGRNLIYSRYCIRNDFLDKMLSLAKIHD